MYVDSEDLIRSSNGWGGITVPGGRAELPGHADLLHRALPAPDRRRRWRPSTPSTTRRTSSSTTRSAGRTGRSTSASSPATTRSTARACARTRPRSPATCSRPATSTRCTTSRFSKMIQPRLGATWAYNGKDTVYASYARYIPGRQLAAPRRVVGPQPDRDLRGHPLRRERRDHRVSETVGSSSGQALRRGPRPADGRRVPGRHRAADQPRVVGARSTAGTARARTSGRTPTTTRASPSTRPRASRASCTSRTWPRGWPRSAAAPPT